jgi:plastocyanin
MVAFGPCVSQGADKTINIKPNGPNAQYIEQGVETQLNVVITVGDKVTWMNMGDRKHTATSDIKVNGEFLFNTGDIDKNTSSKPIEFNDALYDAAVKATGVKPGERVHLGYFCGKHPKLMGGKIVLQPVGFKEEKGEDHE